jgi:hypothetical protein
MELMAQVRHTGRMLSNFRIALGGKARLKVDVDLGSLVPRDVFRVWRFRTQYWLLDIRIRTNMTSSAWIDLGDTISTKDGTVVDEDGAEILGREVLWLMDELPEYEVRGVPVDRGGWRGQPDEAADAVSARSRGPHYRKTNVETVSM